MLVELFFFLCAICVSLYLSFKRRTEFWTRHGIRQPKRNYLFGNTPVVLGFQGQKNTADYVLEQYEEVSYHHKTNFGKKNKKMYSYLVQRGKNLRDLWELWLTHPYDQRLGVAQGDPDQGFQLLRGQDDHARAVQRHRTHGQSLAEADNQSESTRLKLVYPIPSLLFL